MLCKLQRMYAYATLIFWTQREKCGLLHSYSLINGGKQIPDYSLWAPEVILSPLSTFQFATHNIFLKSAYITEYLHRYVMCLPFQMYHTNVCIGLHYACMGGRGHTVLSVTQ